MGKISLIHIKVKECHENEETYFLWTSPELEWLLIEAKSIEELESKAPWVINAYLKTLQEVKEMQNIYDHKMSIFFNWEKMFTLA